MDLGISGKLALVVGGSRGMGLAVALELQREGCKVATVSRTQGPLTNGITCFGADLMLRGAAGRLVDLVKEGFGSPDIIYYAIGGSWNGLRDTALQSESWAEVWRFNLGIAVDLNNAFLPAMVERKWGRVVHTSSDATKCNSGNAPYSSSKFAVEGYVKVASKQFARHNVIISAVSPGPIYTEGRHLYSRSPEETQSYFDKYLPIQRFGRAEEVAKVIAFLCSEHAAFMPGAIVEVHGGSR